MAGYPHYQNLIFAVPLTGRPIPPQVMFAWHSMALPMNYNHMLLSVTGMPIDAAREHFAEDASKVNAKYIFFWDEDVACPPQTIPELIYKMEHHPEAAVIGGVYCLKREPPEPLVFRGNGNGPFWNWKAGEFFEVSGIGMGCTVLRVEALKDLKKPWFKTEFNYKPMLDGIASLESWTEDLWFCQRITDTGKWKIYCDSSLLCTHYQMDFPCKPYNLPPDSYPVKHMAIAKGSKKILDIGSGKNHYQTNEGAVITADFSELHTDYRCDLRKLPFNNNEFDIVFSPAIEQFEPYECEEVLTEWIRVLKPAGELRLVVADFSRVIEKVQSNGMDFKQIFQTRRRNAFTLESIMDEMKRVHLVEIEKAPSDDLHIGVRGKKCTMNIN